MKTYKTELLNIHCSLLSKDLPSTNLHQLTILTKIIQSILCVRILYRNTWAWAATTSGAAAHYGWGGATPSAAASP
jgi:hypothetical protein